MRFLATAAMMLSSISAQKFDPAGGSLTDVSGSPFPTETEQTDKQTVGSD